MPIAYRCSCNTSPRRSLCQPSPQGMILIRPSPASAPPSAPPPPPPPHRSFLRCARGTMRGRRPRWLEQCRAPARPCACPVLPNPRDMAGVLIAALTFAQMPNYNSGCHAKNTEVWAAGGAAGRRAAALRQKEQARRLPPNGGRREEKGWHCVQVYAEYDDCGEVCQAGRERRVPVARGARWRRRRTCRSCEQREGVLRLRRALRSARKGRRCVRLPHGQIHPGTR